MRKRTNKIMQQPINLMQKLEIEIILVIVLIIIGTRIIQHFEHISWFDSLYFNIITLAGIGYGDIAPHTVYGKILAMFYGIVGIPLFIVAGTLVVEIVKGRKE